MTPTNKLRLVKRAIKKETPVPGTAFVSIEVLEVRVLQQWWEPSATGWRLGCRADGSVVVETGEWRDVPLEEEA